MGDVPLDAQQAVHPDGSALAPLIMGLDGVDGYAEGSLTAPATAARNRELPFRHHPSPMSVLELRIHGVGGAAPERVLETPTTLQVAGDATAGFYRAWTPSVRTDATVPRREAYCWGGLDYRGRSTALWQLLVAFMFLNLAHWALPSPRLHHTRRAGVLDSLAKALLRLLALVLTLTFVATATTVIVDVVAWQGGNAKILPSWLDWFARWSPAVRAALGFAVVLLVLAVLYLASRIGRRYERLTIPVEPGGQPAAAADWPMARPGFWHGYLTASRQRNVHAAAGAALVTMLAAQPLSGAVVRAGFFRVGMVTLAVAAIMAATPETSREHVTNTTAAAGATVFATVDHALRALAIVSVASAAAAATVLGASNVEYHGTYPGDVHAQTLLLLAEGGGVGLLFVIVLVTFPWRQRRKEHHFSAFCLGFAGPMFAALAFCVGGIFGAAVTLSVANLLGTPLVAGRGGHDTPFGELLFVPGNVYGFGFGAAAAIAAVVVVLIALTVIWHRVRDAYTDGLVRSAYHVELDQLARDAGVCAGRTARARRATASEWAMARLTDSIGRILLTIVVATAGAVTWYDILLLRQQYYFSSLLGPVPDWMTSLASFGSALAVAATALFATRLRVAFTSAAARKQVSLLWDVATFWPRACHPFAPPCYAERAVPEVVDRVRRVTGARGGGLDDPAVAAGLIDWLDPEQAASIAEGQSPILITGYSQGTIISAAVVAQLPPSARARTALLTLACPIRRLYGRAFPHYFGDDYLRTDLCSMLQATGSAPVRWRNLVRRSDFIGGWALSPPPVPPAPSPASAVDREILDPAVLPLDVQIAKARLHTHFDWFQDPQTMPAVRLLKSMLLDDESLR